MKATKQVLLIGNRCDVFERLGDFHELQLARVFAVRDSFLHRRLVELGLPHEVIDQANKSRVVEQIAETRFDILVSNGCPLILPVSRLIQQHQCFLNVHPSLLPHFRGMHPINGVLLRGARWFGATLHFMDDRIDTGRIVHQERRPVTRDLDLGLLYRLAFTLEGEVFARGMRRLIRSGFRYGGRPQRGRGSYYTRRAEDMTADLTEVTDRELLCRIRAFGIPSQGMELALSDGRYRVWDAERIVQSSLLRAHARRAPGDVLLRYDDRLLVKTRQGIVKLRGWQRLD